MPWSSFDRACEAPDRLIIVDPSLRDHIGHHAEYDRAVARAARNEGIAATVLAHRDVTADVAADVPVAPIFSNDMWGNVPAKAGPSRRSIAIHLFRAVQLLVLMPAGLFNLGLRAVDRLRRTTRDSSARRDFDPRATNDGTDVRSEPGPQISLPIATTPSLSGRVIRSWRKYGTAHVIW